MMREVRAGNSEAKKIAKSAMPASSASSSRRLLGVLLLIALGVAFTFAGIKLKNIGGGNSIQSIIGSIANPRGEFAQKDKITILLIGKDYNRYISKTNRALNGMPTSKESRSDSIMLATLDLKSQKVSLLSIPRDTYVYNIDGEAGKINATYRLGGEKRLAATIEKLLGVKPDYFVAVRIPGVAAIVDAVGGVEVETIDAMEYHDFWGGLHVNLPKGKQKINGQEAIGFARYRELDPYERNPDGSPIPILNSNGKPRLDSNGNPLFKRRTKLVHSDEEGDPRRMARQQQLIRAIINKTKSFNNLLKIDEVVNVGLEQIETDLDRMQIFALAALFRSVKPEQIQSGTLPGDGGMRGSYWYFNLDEEKSKLMVDWLVRGDEAAGRALTTIEVQNGTSVAGAARLVVKQLRKGGYNATNGGNAERLETAGELETTRILYRKAAVLPRAKEIAAQLGGGKLIKEAAPDTTGVMKTSERLPDITIVLGKDLTASSADGESDEN